MCCQPPQTDAFHRDPPLELRGIIEVEAWKQVSSVVTHRLVRATRAGERLERLLGDSDERRRLGAGALRRSAELSPERELDAWLDNVGVPGPGELGDVDAETLKRLKALGYLP